MACDKIAPLFLQYWLQNIEIYSLMVTTEY